MADQNPDQNPAPSNPDGTQPPRAEFNEEYRLRAHNFRLAATGFYREVNAVVMKHLQQPDLVPDDNANPGLTVAEAIGVLHMISDGLTLSVTLDAHQARVMDDVARTVAQILFQHNTQREGAVKSLLSRMFGGSAQSPDQPRHRDGDAWKTGG